MFGKFAELYPVLVLRGCVAVLAVLSAVAFCRLLKKRFGVFARLAEMLESFASLPRPQQMFVAVFVLVFIVLGSVKNGGGTDDVLTQSRGGAERGQVARSLGDSESGSGWRTSRTPVTQEEIEAGFRAPAEGTVGIVPPPEGAVTNDAWRLRGAHDDAFRPELADWRFPVRDGALTGLTVLARGEIRPDVGTLYFPVPLTNGLSLLPQARWGLLSRAPEAGAQPNGGGLASGGAPVPDAQASVFWHAQSPSNSLLLTWENALVGRDPNGPTNLQAELYSDGRFAWRTDDTSRLYLPVFDFDWDGDGLENSVDPDPLVAGPDAHGTNAEWYKVVCTNVFEEGESGGNGGWWAPNGMVSLPAGVAFRAEVARDAYYSVDVVAEWGPAPIYFIGDQAGLLGSPVVVARAGETNRVPLQVGVTYAVTSAVPFSLSFPMGNFAVVDRDDPCEKSLCWPVRFSVETFDGGHTVVVTPYPSDPGGTYVWRRPGEPLGTGGAQARDAASGSGCSYGTDGGCVFFHCEYLGCGCEGCRLEGDLFCDGVYLGLPTIWCGCSGDHGGEEEETPPAHAPDPLVGGLTISFSRQAVFFEDRYTNAPNDVVARRSTRTRLTISASGGQMGGSFSLNSQNLANLVVADGPGPIMLISDMELEPYETYFASYECEGLTPSVDEDDVVVDGTFTESVTGWMAHPSAAVTVVKVGIKPDQMAPANQCEYRHDLGVYEIVGLRHTPSIDSVKWILQGGGSEEDSVEGFVGRGLGGTYELRCPLYDNGATLKVSCKGVDYFPFVHFVEPTGVTTRNPAGCKGRYSPGVYGAYMEFDMFVVPLTVSFGQIAIEEIPSEDMLYDWSTCSGYFLSDPIEKRSHTYEMGAGRWFAVRSSDHRFARDRVDSGTLLAVEEDGAMSWAIPVGWHRRQVVNTPGNGRHPFFREFAPNLYWQDFFVSTNGTTSIAKHGHWVWRNLSDDVWLDGEMVR